MCFYDREQKQEIIKRRRERVALDSLRDLILHMASIREGRTAVLTITEGWLLYRPSEALTHLAKDPLTASTQTRLLARRHRSASARAGR